MQHKHSFHFKFLNNTAQKYASLAASPTTTWLSPIAITLLISSSSSIFWHIYIYIYIAEAIEAETQVLLLIAQTEWNGY